MSATGESSSSTLSSERILLDNERFDTRFSGMGPWEQMKKIAYTMARGLGRSLG